MNEFGRSTPIRSVLRVGALLTLVCMAIMGVPLMASAAEPGSELWLTRYDGAAHRGDSATSIGVSPDGSMVFATGASAGVGSHKDYATVAYDASSGVERWTQRYDGPRGRRDYPKDLVVSPDGSTVFVTGDSVAANGKADYATLAYDAATGNELWRQRYDGPRHLRDSASAIETSPDGGVVFVTGGSVRSASMVFATVAYDATTGDQLWAARNTVSKRTYSAASAIAVSPDGSALFVTGTADGGANSQDYATMAYDAASGTRLWVARYDGPDGTNDYARAIAVSPTGSEVFVTGSSRANTTGADALTLAYDTATGASLWTMRYNGPGNRDDSGAAIAIDPTGSTVFVTGYSYRGTESIFDYTTIAYDTLTGDESWATPYTGTDGYDFASALAVSPDGSEVFVTGTSDGSSADGDDRDYATVAYDAATGDELWTQRYDGPAEDQDILHDAARDLVVSPDGSAVFLTGGSVGSTTGTDYATVAYSI